MFISEFSFLSIEDFCETILLDKQGLKKIVQDYRMQLFLDIVEYNRTKLKDKDIQNILEGKELAKYHFNRLFYVNKAICFLENIKKLIISKKIFFNSLTDKIGISEDYFNQDDQKSLILINDIYCLNEKYMSLLGFENDLDFIEVKKEIEDIYAKFMQDYFSFKAAKNRDQIRAGISLINKQIVKFEEYKKSDKKIIYLDTNVFSKIMEAPTIKEKIISSKKKYQYCYSSYILEDKIKQNVLFTDSVKKLITEITDNVIIGCEEISSKMSMNFFNESPDFAYERVKLWLETTQSAEDNQYNQKILDSISYVKNEKVKTFDTQTMLNYLRNPDEQLLSLSNLIGVHGVFVSADQSIPDKIQGLLRILNLLEFRVDKEKNKVISSFQDDEHLKVAYIADFFVSSDKKLLDRAKVVYEMCNCQTTVCSLDDFLSNL